MLTLYRCLRSGDLRSSGVTERHNGPLGLCDDNDDDDDERVTYGILHRRSE